MNNNEGTMKGKVGRELKTLSFSQSFRILLLYWLTTLERACLR